MSGIGGEGISNIQAKLQAGLLKEQSIEAKQADARAAFIMDDSAYSVFNPLEMAKYFKKLAEQASKIPSEEQLEAETENEELVKRLDEAMNTAKAYAKRNSELNPHTLLKLLSNLRSNMSEAEMLEEVLREFPDPSIADDAIDFLIETSEEKKAIQDKMIRAKEDFNSTYGREIRAGKNIAPQAVNYSELGLGTKSELRDLYRDITGNPREPIELFEELSMKFEFKQMKVVIDFFLHALGQDLKSKGTSIDPLELKRLLVDGRQMMAIFDVYGFFQVRFANIAKKFAKYHLPLPMKLNFITLSRLLIYYFKERFPSAEKFRQLGKMMEIQNHTLAQIIVFTQYRDAMRHMPPRLFKSERHRQDLLMTILETLSDLEDELEEEENG
ncbi:MAG: HrpJ domain-containing protein [Candidatus Algichlamydia australiensis]|nr:HrpJ domain-containing protein [Chlamydiales bacterium]